MYITFYIVNIKILDNNPRMEKSMLLHIIPPQKNPFGNVIPHVFHKQISPKRNCNGLSICTLLLKPMVQLYNKPSQEETCLSQIAR
jgi:hypothetical protein